MNKNLLILGAGQFAYVVEEIALAMGKFDKISFLDDSSERAIGKLDELEKFKEEYSYGIVAIGNPQVRRSLIERLEKYGYCLPTLIHPSAYISKTAIVGKGTIIEPLCGVNSNTSIGCGCIISMGAQVNHNVNIQDYCHIDCGAVICSNKIVLSGTKICFGNV